MTIRGGRRSCLAQLPGNGECAFLTFMSQTLQKGDVIQTKNLADLGLFSQQLQVLSSVVEQQVPPSERFRRKELKSGLFFSSDSKQVLRTKASNHRSKQALPRTTPSASSQNRHTMRT